MQRYNNSARTKFGAIYVIFHVTGGEDVSLGPHRLIKGRRVTGGRRREGAGYNGGAISDGNARHVGMRYTAARSLIRERFVVFFIDDSCKVKLRYMKMKFILITILLTNLNLNHR